MGGKTGTAQVVVKGRYSDTVFTTFVGFHPVRNPVFTVVVMARGAKRLYQGSQLGAPIFRDITAGITGLYGIPPSNCL